LSGEVRFDKKTGALTLKTLQVITEGEKEFKPLSADELTQGCMFLGQILVADKKASERNGQTYLSALVSFLGGAHTFNMLTPEQYTMFPEKGKLVQVSGQVQTNLESYQEDSRWLKRHKLILDLQQIQAIQLNPPQKSAA
jgi:hypothetical protein